MARRKPPRRFLRQRPIRSAAEARVLQALRRAHRQMDAGQYEQAFPTFKRLADAGAARGMPAKAAQLYFQAARARLEMGSAPDSMTLATRGLELLTQVGRIDRARAVLPRLLESLEEKGYYQEAVTLRAQMQALSAGLPPTREATEREHLPSQCPSCGGPVRSDQVDWIDVQSAECIFCGSVIQTK